MTRPFFSIRRIPRAASLLPWLVAGCAASGIGQTLSGFTVAPASREQAREFYNTVYQASAGVPSGWTGSVPLGIAGTTSQAFKDAVNRRVNYFRAMAGVPATIAFSDAFSAEDQQAALMASANASTVHNPPTSWFDYTAAGAEAAGASNLALGLVEEGPTAIVGYMTENGSDNAAVGHRRWVLYPPETLMGTGDVDGGDPTQYAANALWVLDTASFASPAPAPRDGFVAWPPPGYVPYTLVFPRWSFSYPGADFTAATVSMTRNGAAVAVQLETPTNGYGDNTLIWVPDGQDPSQPFTPTAPTSEVAATVTVGNVLINGVAQSFTYAVTPFDPTKTGADTVRPVLSGPAAPAEGAAYGYTFNAVPNATGYRWSASTITPLTLDLDAESGPGDVTISPAGANVVSTANPASGAASYHFSSYPAQTMTLNAVVVPQTGAKLAFQSQLELATTDETARVQISTDGGSNWSDLYALSGATVTGTSVATVTEAAYAAHSLDLSAYAGETCQLRFVYAFVPNGVSSYFPVGNMEGWYVDNIVLTGAQTVSASSSTDLPAGVTHFAFLPPAAGAYGLQVEPLFFGGYAADASPVLTVTATSPTVGVSATSPTASASGGTAGVFTFTRTGGDIFKKTVVAYTIKGGAVSGADYAMLSGRVKIRRATRARR